jgi:hypothetical protein
MSFSSLSLATFLSFLCFKNYFGTPAFNCDVLRKRLEVHYLIQLPTQTELSNFIMLRRSYNLTSCRKLHGSDKGECRVR